MQSFDFKPILYNETLKITLYGTLDKFTLPQLIKYLNKKKYIFLEFNLEHLKKIDSIATIYLISLNNINITNKDKFTDQIEYYKKHYISNKNIKKRNSLNYLEKLGKSTYEKIIELNQFIYFFGKLFFFSFIQF